MLRRTTNFVVNFIRKDISNVAKVSAGFIVDEESKRDIFKLRYDVMARNKSLFPKDHYCIRNRDEFRDDYDDDPSTKHFLVRHKGKAVASCRLLDGNKVKFEIEKYKWFDIRSSIWTINENVNNIIEPTRVVSCKSITGSFIAPLMLTHCLLDMYDSKHESFIGVVNADSMRLIKHYKTFMPSFTQLSKEKFAVDEYIPGRFCHVFISRIGASEKERDLYILTTLLPCFLLYKSIYWRSSNKL
jgi:hypothetical protein